MRRVSLSSSFHLAVPGTVQITRKFPIREFGGWLALLGSIPLLLAAAPCSAQTSCSRDLGNWINGVGPIGDVNRPAKDQSPGTGALINTTAPDGVWRPYVITAKHVHCGSSHLGATGYITLKSAWGSVSRFQIVKVAGAQPGAPDMALWRLPAGDWSGYWFFGWDRNVNFAQALNAETFSLPFLPPNPLYPDTQSSPSANVPYRHIMFFGDGGQRHSLTGNHIDVVFQASQNEYFGFGSSGSPLLHDGRIFAIANATSAVGAPSPCVFSFKAGLQGYVIFDQFLNELGPKHPATNATINGQFGGYYYGN